MTDGFERKDMNTNDSEQVQSFSTADNTQQATGTSANTEAQASYTSGAANNANSGYNGTSYSSTYNAQQNAYNSYYRYAGNMNNAQHGMNGMNNGQNNVHVDPNGGKAPKKKGSKAAMVAGIIAIALVVGGGAGFAGTVLAITSVLLTVCRLHHLPIRFRQEQITAVQTARFPLLQQHLTHRTRLLPLLLTRAR